MSCWSWSRRYVTFAFQQIRTYAHFDHRSKNFTLGAIVCRVLVIDVLDTVIVGFVRGSQNTCAIGVYRAQVCIRRCVLSKWCVWVWMGSTGKIYTESYPRQKYSSVVSGSWAAQHVTCVFDLFFAFYIYTFVTIDEWLIVFVYNHILLSFTFGCKNVIL